MDYLIFARKFRPQTFDQLIGQDPVSVTLKNAIKQERISQSFLFAGPRGVGKTSAARILAKALNCAKGPAEEPCGKCTSCVEITQGNSLDVLEIDGASNRGIDEIRNLRETVKFKPVTGRFKVYIIDEVHMLTQEAFNALLKTLEEPPPHVKFIFATTESHKVPLTILSRCQRFQFKRIPSQQIVQKLETIVKSEKLKAEKNALCLIARASEGALRDAESLLDQLASFADGKISEQDVLTLLGLAPDEIYLEVLGAVQSKDAAKIFSVVSGLYDDGKDLVQFAKGLLEIFRHLLIFQCAEQAEKFIEAGENVLPALKKISAGFSRGELLMAVSLLANLQQQLRRNIAPPKLLIEALLLKLLHLGNLKPIDGLLGTATETAAPSAGSSARPAARSSESRPAENLESRQIPSVSPKKVVSPRASAGMETPSQAVSSSTALADPPKDLGEIEGLWPRIIEYVKSKRMSTGIFLSESSLLEMNESQVTLGLPREFQFHKDTLQKDTNRRLVEEAFEMVGGRKVRAQFVITQVFQEAGPLAAVPSTEGKKVPDIVHQALEIFDGGKIVKKE